MTTLHRLLIGGAIILLSFAAGVQRAEPQKNKVFAHPGVGCLHIQDCGTGIATWSDGSMAGVLAVGSPNDTGMTSFSKGDLFSASHPDYAGDIPKGSIIVTNREEAFGGYTTLQGGPKIMKERVKR